MIDFVNDMEIKNIHTKLNEIIDESNKMVDHINNLNEKVNEIDKKLNHKEPAVITVKDNMVYAEGCDNPIGIVHGYPINEHKNDILTCSLDGNCLSVIREDFIDLAESPSVFIKLYEEQIAEIKQLMNGDLK